MDFETPWKLAAYGELDGLQKLKDTGVRLDEKDERGFSPLCWAARNGHVEVAEYLVKSVGCSPEDTSFGGMTPLHHACNKSNERVIKFLVGFGVDVNSSDENGDTALHYAAARGILNVVVLLLEAGANLKIANGQGITPLHKACLFGQYPVVRRFLECGADPNVKDLYGETPLHYGSKCGFPLVVRLLLDSNANILSKNSNGFTAKQLAQSKAVMAVFPDDAADE